jgi:RNA polymerase sigma-70 factor, ECF subfamily
MNEHDRSQLKLIFETHFDAVYAYIAFRLAPDFESAADLAQQVFEAAVTRWDSIKDRNSVKPWLMEVARHKVVDVFRHESTARRTLALESAQHVPDRSNLASIEIQRETATAIAHALRDLREDHCQLLEERYLWNLPVAVMAKNRSTTEKAVESALDRARSAFRNSFARIQRSQEVSQ